MAANVVQGSCRILQRKRGRVPRLDVVPRYAGGTDLAHQVGHALDAADHFG